MLSDSLLLRQSLVVSPTRRQSSRAMLVGLADCLVYSADGVFFTFDFVPCYVARVTFDMFCTIIEADAINPVLEF
jgi:hypothetical protein